MTKWQNKEIKDLTDNELVKANDAVDRTEAAHTARIAERRERHKKIEFGRNPAFDQLKLEIETELTKRGLS